MSTKGFILATRIDERGKPESISGERRGPSKRALERLAQKEYERRTRGGFSTVVCQVCYQALSRNGTCDCSDEPMSELDRLKMMIGID